MLFLFHPCATFLSPLNALTGFCLVALVFFPFLWHLHTMPPTSATHRAAVWSPAGPTFSSGTTLGNSNNMKGCNISSESPCFPPFQLALQLSRAELATLLDFSSALCYAPVCRRTKRELDGFCKLEWDVGSPLPASDLSLLTMNNGNTLTPRCFCAPCGVRMGPRAWTWLWDRVFWFPAFFVQHRAEARASTGVFPCYTWWHLPLRGCFVAENSKSIKQRPRKTAMCKCPINSIRYHQLPSSGKQQHSVLLQHLCLQDPGATTDQRMVLAPEHGLSDWVLLLGVNIPSAKPLAAPPLPNGWTGTRAVDLEVAFPLGVKTYCQSEHLQPYG